MVVISILRIAFDAIRAHKLRSGLTLLGIIVGVTSVMTIISALEGMSDNMKKQFASLGSTTFIVTRMGIVTSHEMFLDKIKRKPFKVSYREDLERMCPSTVRISSAVEGMDKLSYESNKLRDVEIHGVEQSYIEIVDENVALGRFHSIEDDTYGRRVAYIGESVREALFGTLDPLGKDIRIGSTKYTVIGVSKKKGELFGENQDEFVIIPFAAYVKQYGEPKRRLYYYMKAASIEALPATMDEARLALRTIRQVPYAEDDDFDLLTADNILDILNSFLAIVKGALVGISSISLVVGGIVVMNIMMVAVTERTREIGIRKSLGATRRHVLLQFLFESLMLTVSGGLVGIAIGVVLAKVLVQMIGMEIEASTFAMIAGVSISTGIGLIFGIYPAMKAARLSPIKALSYE